MARVSHEELCSLPMPFSGEIQQTRTCVDPGEASSGSRDEGSQDALTGPNVEDALTGLRRQEPHDNWNGNLAVMLAASLSDPPVVPAGQRIPARWGGRTPVVWTRWSALSRHPILYSMQGHGEADSQDNHEPERNADEGGVAPAQKLD